MLQKIQRDDFETLVAHLKGDDTIACDPETGATLHKSDGQYSLIISRNPYKRAHWSRRTVHSDQDAIQLAQKRLDKEGMRQL